MDSEIGEWWWWWGGAHHGAAGDVDAAAQLRGGDVVVAARQPRRQRSPPRAGGSRRVCRAGVGLRDAVGGDGDLVVGAVGERGDGAEALGGGGDGGDGSGEHGGVEALPEQVGGGVRGPALLGREDGGARPAAIVAGATRVEPEEVAGAGGADPHKAVVVDGEGRRGCRCALQLWRDRHGLALAAARGWGDGQGATAEGPAVLVHVGERALRDCCVGGDGCRGQVAAQAAQPGVGRHPLTPLREDLSAQREFGTPTGQANASPGPLRNQSPLNAQPRGLATAACGRGASGASGFLIATQCRQCCYCLSKKEAIISSSEPLKRPTAFVAQCFSPHAAPARNTTAAMLTTTHISSEHRTHPASRRPTPASRRARSRGRPSPPPLGPRSRRRRRCCRSPTSASWTGRPSPPSPCAPRTPQTRCTCHPADELKHCFAQTWFVGWAFSADQTLICSLLTTSSVVEITTVHATIWAPARVDEGFCNKLGSWAGRGAYGAIWYSPRSVRFACCDIAT